MSIQTELTRLTNAKAAIKTAIEGKGVTVPEGTLLDGMAALIESIEAGGGSSAKDFYFGTTKIINISATMFIPGFNIPDVLVITGPLYSSSADRVGLAIHIKDADGGIYQEKWRYQSTKYLIGTSVTDGSLFTLSEKSGSGFFININSGESSFGRYFSVADYKVFAAKLF